MRRQWARRIASGGAVVSAVLYFGIGFGFVSIGSSWDLLGACFGIGLVMLVMSVVVMDVRGRLALGIFGAFVAALVVGYLATVGTRTLAFEAWGIALQAVQLVILGAIGYLVLDSGLRHDHGRPPKDVLTWKASSA